MILWTQIGHVNDRTYAMLVPGGMIVERRPYESTRSSTAVFVPLGVEHNDDDLARWIEERRTR